MKGPHVRITNQEPYTRCPPHTPITATLERMPRSQHQRAYMTHCNQQAQTLISTLPKGLFMQPMSK